MMRPKVFLAVVIVLLLCGINAIAQKRNTLIIAEDHLILQFSLKSSEKELDSLFKVAGIGHVYVEQVLKGNFTGLTNDGWNMAEREKGFVSFDRSLSDLNINAQSKPYLITTRIPQIAGKPGYPEKVNYGINKYAKITVYELSSGLTRFILPGYQKAKRAFLSGNFNNWSTLKGLMKKTDGGWLIDVKLAPGAYEYKYIVDGHWMTDPNNLGEMDDGIGNVNSVYYKYNYTFKLPGYPTAQKVALIGDFNKWDANQALFEKKGKVWERQLYLKDGMHIYCFVVDGRRITDPGNPNTVKDDAGNINSVLNLGETVYFKLNGYQDAKKVNVAGSFNNWRPDEFALKKTGNTWVLPLILTAGNYGYKFIVDGKWMADPANPHLSVENGETNSFLSVRPNYTFKLKGYGNAKKVVITGTFDDWDPNGCTMEHRGDEWVVSFNLKQGKYLYKFRVDGAWIIDPGNKLWEQNEFNTGNSVLWIE